VDARTRLLSVSAVQWTDGLRLDLEKLGAACQVAETLFFVDAIQLLGAQEVDVQACQIDFLAADGHKWLLAPEGLAVFYSTLAARNQLRLLQHGWHMTDNPYLFNREDWPASETASRFEAGTPNMLGQVGLYASVELLLEYGMTRIDAAVSANSAQLSAGIEQIAGTHLIKPYDPKRSSGIVCFDVPGIRLPDLLEALAQQQVTCTIRGGGIRLSPHFYQTGKAIAELLDVIERTVFKLSMR
jgi:selenocysteine lyase/cysteine desulfurase